MKTTEQVLDILRQCTIENKVVFLPPIQLDRQLYTEVNDVLVALGAKWDRKSKGHIFDYDISKEFEKVLVNGEYTNWKKETEWFFTPKEVALHMISLLPLYYNSEFTILEPSAGDGSIIDNIKENYCNAKITCVEMNPQHCERLKNKGYSPINCMFEDYSSDNKFDYIVMNPPFKLQVEHIRKAFDHLIPGGMLVSVASNGIMSNSTKKFKEFQDWLKNKGTWEPLPSNSFKESGTNVNCILLIITKEDE